MDNPVTDKDLVLKCLNGSDRDFERLIKRYSKKLYLFIYNRTGNNEDTEDIVQETFLKVYRNLSSYDPKWSFSTWIYTIAARTASSHFRHENVRKKGPMIQLNPATTPEEEILKEDISGIWKAAGKLSKAKHEIIRLRYGDGLSIREIGKITGKSSVNIRVMIFRAKSELIRIINSTGEISSALQNDPEKSMT
ncbi:MAG: sigma-70 family RNA polymerase sigma factor [Acidobacteriota bacterium]